MKALPELLEYFLSDCLEGNRNYTIRRMFGGYGVYFRGKIFAIYAFERIYFKVGERNRWDFLEKNARIFSYEKQGKIATISYYELPEDILEDREELERWIEKALEY